jgi:hypothetical protein
MKQFLFISLLLFSLKNYSQTQDSILVSLENEIEIAKNDSLKVKAMLQLGEYHLDKNFSKARYLIYRIPRGSTSGSKRKV